MEKLNLTMTGMADDLFYSSEDNKIKVIKLMHVYDEYDLNGHINTINKFSVDDHRNLSLEFVSQSNIAFHPEISLFLGKKIKITVEVVD